MAVKSVEEITAELRALNRMPKSVGSLTTGVQSSTSEDKENQNRGGVIGGVGYVGEKTGLGFLSTIEGAVDYTTGTIAKVIADITGNSDILDWGKSQFTEDWVNYNHADEWYNPSEGWKIAGDVGSGIGNSLAIVGVSALTGSPAAGMVFSGLGAAGNATKEAVLQTGELTGKEIAYGAMSGATEILMEKASSALGIGTQRIVRSVTKRLGKEAVESVVKPSFKQLVKNIGEDFLSEAFEEGTQEILEQHYKRWTYDETAKNASVKEVEYAAIVGGLSGAVMSGGHAAITTTGNILSGNTSIKNGTVDQILDNAKRIAEIEDSSDTGYEVFRSIRDQYRELSQSLPADGNYTIKQRAQLGSLKRAEVAAAFVPELERSAIKVINSAEEMAQYVNDLGLKKADGSKLTVTAEDIRGGIDPNATGKKALKEFRKQIETNPLLTTLATMDAVGRLQANAAQMQTALENGTASGNRFYQSAQQLNALREKATPEQLAAIGKVLGISDWATVNAEEFAKKVQKVGKEEQQRAAERQNAVETAPTPFSAESAGGTEGAFGSAVPAGGMYALKEQNPVDGYTEQQYNSFGWVRSNGILTSEQYNDFSSKFADIKSGRVKGTPVSKDGYYMIAVGGLTDGTGFGVDNIVVLAKGSLENPEIGCIYEIFGDNETYLGEKRRNLYESERRGIQPEAGKLFRRYDSASYVFSDSRKVGKGNRYRSGNGNGGGSRPQAERAAKRIVEYDFENGTVTYADGTKEADPDSTKQESRNGSEKEAADIRSPETGKSDLPESLSSLPYGARRYQIGGNDFILIKTDRNGYDGYELRDNESGRWSKVLDRAQAEKVLKSIKTASETAQNTELSSALKSAGEYAEKNIPEYRRLMEPGKSAVRNTIMQARVYGLSDSDVKLYARISSKSGLNIVFDPKLGIYEDSKGYYNNGTVFIDPNEGKESSFRKILAHENGHALIESFPKLGRKIERFALKHIDTEKRNRIIELYRNYFGDHISKEALLDEINSAYSEELAETESFWEFLLADEPTIKEKVLSFFGKSAQKYSFEEGLSREARKYMTMYRKMFNRFSEINRGNNSFAGDALIRSDNAKKGEDNINYYDKEITGKRYNLRDDFGQQIRDWLSGGGKKNGSFNGRYFDLGTTPDVLIKHGAKHLPVIMFEDCMVKITGGKGDDAHSFSIDELSKLPEALNDPILLFKGSYPDSFVALTELTDKSGNDSVVAIHLNKVLDRTVINKIASIYSKTNEYGINKIKNYVYHQIENGNLLDASTKKAPNWFTSRGLQLPKLVQTILDASRSDGETVDHKIRLTSSATTGNSISQTSEKINTSEKKITEISEKNPDIRRSLKNTATDNITDSDLKSLRAIGRKSVNSFTSEEIQATEKWARKFYRELGTKSPFFRAWFGDWRAKDTGTIDTVIASETTGKNPRGVFKNKDTGWNITSSSVGYDETVSHSGKDKSSIAAMRSIDKLIENAILLDTEISEPGRGKKSVYTAFMHKLYSLVYIDGKPHIAKISVDESYLPGQEDTNKKFYHVRAIKIESVPSVGIGESHTPIMEKTASAISISDLFDLVKQYDQEFSPNTVNPVLLNEDGTPKKFYHQTEEDFTEFDLSRKTNSASDSETPNGIFLKSSDSDIGIRGNIQMELYASVSNTLTFPNREAAVKWYSDHIPGYQEISQKIKDIDRIYNERYDKQEKICDDFYESHYDDVISGRMSEEEFQRGAEEGLDRILEDWKSKSDKAGTAARKLLDRYFEESDYDSIYLRNDKGSNGRKTDALIVFDKGNVKSATDNIGTFDRKNPDIRRSLKDDADISERRSAAASKLIANYNRQRMYNKADAQAVRNKALEEVFREYLDQDSSVDMNRKASETLDSYLLEQLNTAEPGERSDYALKAADYAIRNLIIQRSTSDSDTESMESASVTYAQLKKYLHSMDLSGIRDDIRTGFGERAKTVLSMWSKKGGITPGAAARELADAGIRIDAQSESEIFREIVDLYEMNRDAAKKKVEKITLESFASEEEYRNILQKFASSLLRAADETGSESKYARLRRQYLQETEQLKTLLRDGGERNRAINRVIYSAERFRDTKNGAFTNATEIGSQEFLKIAGELSRVLSRGNLNSRAAISALQKLYNHYTSQDIKKSLEAKGIYSEDLANLLNEITTEGDASESALAEAALRMYQARNAEELDLENINDCRKLRDWYSKKNLGDSYDLSTKIALQHFADQNYISTGNLRKMAMVIDGFAHLIKSYNKAFFRGRWVDASEMASSFVSDIQKNSNIKRSPLTRIMESRYMRTFADPMVLARWMDRYNDNGFFSSMLADLRDGAIRESILDMDIRRGIDDFYRKNKSWRKEIQNTIVPFNGADLTKAEAMQLYMTLHRDQAIPGILYNGFELREGKDRIRVSGIVDPDADISEAELRKIAEKTASQLESSFSETDKQYIAIVETVYQQCRQLKYETDIARQGFSNVQDGYYVPLARANIAHSIDADYIGESMSVTNQSFNKNTVKGAKGELMILPIDQVVDRHISGITKYAALASAMDSFDMLFNLDVSGNKNKAVSIATETELVWSDYFKYMQNLRNDLRGLSRDTDGLNRIFGKMRGKYATAVLGMNVKVLATQFSSLFASTSILSPKNIIRGMTIDSSMVDQYCRIAEVRNYDQTAALAQSVTEKLDGIGDLLTKPIGMFDRLNVRVLFGACQAQIASDGGPKIGSEENRIAAGKLLERVILETQQNATATDRSAAMRSGSEVMKSFTMFTADSMKVVGRLFDAVGKRSVLSDRLSNAQSAAEKSEIRKEIRTANKQLAKSVGAIVSSSVYMAILAQAFRWIYGKDDDKEKIPENIVLDSFGNMLGGLPIISDAYDYIVNGFEFGDSNYDMLNDLAEATKKGFRVIGDAVSGEADSKEALTAVKSIVFSASKFLGLPAQNLWNLSYGAIKRTMPRAAYLIDDAFKSQSYRKDLSAAIEAGDEEMAETVLNVWAKNKLGKFEKEETAEAIKELLKNGYSVLPKTIGDSISVNGTEYELSANDKKLFSSIYGGYTDELDSMIGSQAFFLLNKQAQAKAINTVYDSYYNQSVKSVLGLDSNSTVSLAEKFLGLSDYAIANAAISSMTAETDKQGKAISGTKKKKAIAYLLRQNMTDEERLLILVLSGYSIQDGDFKNMTASAAKKKLLKYILNRSGATANEKIALCNKIGFEVKNGKISASSIK